MTLKSGHTPRFRLLLAGHLASAVALAVLLAGCGMGKAVTDYVDARDTGVRKRVVIASFTSAIKEREAQAESLNKSLREALGRQGGIALADFTALQDEILKVDPGVRNPEDRALKAGRQMGLTAIVAGNLVDLSVKYKLKGIYGLRDNTPFLGLEAEMKVLAPGTGTVAAQGSFRRELQIDDIVAEAITNGAAPDSAMVAKLLGEVTKDCQDYLITTILAQPWVGTVLEVAGDRILVNLGRDSGLSVGSQLTVYAVAERLRRVGGQEIDLPGAAVARVRLVEMGQRSSWAVAVEGAEKKGAFEPGQTLRTR